MRTEVKTKNRKRQTFNRGDKLVKGTQEIARVLTGEKCEVCKKPLEEGQGRLCFSCEVVVYG